MVSKNWIEWLCTETCKQFNGRVAHNGQLWCHESEIAFPRLQIEFLLPRSTAKYQTFDLRLVAYSNIRYISNLLRKKIDVMIERQSRALYFPSSSQQGIYGVWDGLLRTIGCAIETFGESRHDASRFAVMKCLMKSECLWESDVHWCPEKFVWYASQSTRKWILIRKPWFLKEKSGTSSVISVLSNRYKFLILQWTWFWRKKILLTMGSL